MLCMIMPSVNVLDVIMLSVDILGRCHDVVRLSVMLNVNLLNVIKLIIIKQSVVKLSVIRLVSLC